MRGSWKYTENDDTLFAAVSAELHRLSSYGHAPSIDVWNARKSSSVPTAHYLMKRFACGWPAIVARSGLRTAKHGGARPPRGASTGRYVQSACLADEIERGLAEGRIEHATWMDRFRAVLHALPTPTRVEEVIGRSVAGEPVVIRREYWMLR